MGDFIFRPQAFDDLDASLRDHWGLAQAKGKPTLPVRVTVLLYNYPKQVYLPWRGISWGGEIESIAEGKQLRHLLVLVFQLARQMGIDGLLSTLKDLDARRRDKVPA